MVTAPNSISRPLPLPVQFQRAGRGAESRSKTRCANCICRLTTGIGCLDAGA
jgi:hypothetical protein